MSHLLAQSEEHEARAAEERIEYYQRVLSTAGGRSEVLLDVGCGNGYSVLEWRSRGCTAFGVDSSIYRLSRWVVEHSAPIPLVVSDAGALPFKDGAFDIVVSSGMIEHVGVDEVASPYTVQARPDQEESRRRVVSEMVRATRESGNVFIDFPNGSFPIDFWHGDNVGAFRVHGFPDDLLPSFRDIGRWARCAGSEAVVQPLSGRLKFRQVGRHWWGRLFSPVMRAAIAALDLLSRIGLGGLVAPAYPYLVVELRGDESRGRY